MSKQANTWLIASYAQAPNNVGRPTKATVGQWPKNLKGGLRCEKNMFSCERNGGRWEEAAALILGGKQKAYLEREKRLVVRPQLAEIIYILAYIRRYLLKWLQVGLEFSTA
ncbi:MAG: hypothetical protein EOO60_08295 [Hymenobacter sp.]|nr:MAG: hypothetical protein EOO60_08295 [Hymenobacter sp.]